MFTPKMPPRRRKGELKGESKSPLCLDKGWFELLTRYGVLSQECLGAGASYSRLRLRIRCFNGLHCRYQQSRVYQVYSFERKGAVDNRQSIQSALEKWSMVKKRVRPEDLNILDYCTFEPVNYRLTDQQIQELGKRVSQALKPVADVLATDIDSK